MSKAAELAALIGSQSALSNRNLIINGAAVLDQRNSGSSVTPTSDNTYTLDRWKARLSASSKFSVQQSSTAPAGFNNSILATSLAATSLGASDYYVIQQNIEGYNIANLGWGTSSAKDVTLSFYVRSSLTGTFGGVFTNSAFNRSYPFSYSISSADTWEKKTVTVSGDTSGTWLATNGTGLQVVFSLGMGSTYSGTAGAWSGSTLLSVTGATSVVGTSGATWYITGVQLEVGEQATPFEHLSYADELQRCQRYFLAVANQATYAPVGVGRAWSGTTGNAAYYFPVEMRANTAISVNDLSKFDIVPSGGNPTEVRNDGGNKQSAKVGWVSSGVTNGNFYQFEFGNNQDGALFFDAEL